MCRFLFFFCGWGLPFASDVIPWDAAEFAASKTKSPQKFPPPDFGLKTEPAIFVDVKGRILAWYLPRVLLPPRQVSLFMGFYLGTMPTTRFCCQRELVEAVGHITPLLVKEVKKAKNAKNPNWRCNETSFVKAHPSRSFPKGCATFSAGWFAQGHGVCLISFCPHYFCNFLLPSLLKTILSHLSAFEMTRPGIGWLRQPKQ